MTLRSILLTALLTGCANQVTKDIPQCGFIFGDVVVGGETGTKNDPCRKEELLPTDFSFSNLRMETPWFLTYYFRTGELVFRADPHTPRMPSEEAGVWNVVEGGFGYQYGDVEGQSSYRVTIRAPAERRNNLQLDVVGDGVAEDGIVSCRSDGGICEASYGIGERIALVATPDEGWVLESAAGCEALMGGGELAGDTECRIVFRRVEGGGNALTVDVQGRGMVFVSGSDRACGSDQSCEFDVGSGAVMLSAQPDVELRYRFSGWEGCASGSENPLTLSIEGPTTCRAIFVRDQGVDCSSAPPITPGVIQVLDTERTLLGTSETADCSIMVGRNQSFIIRAEGFVSAVSPALIYSWDLDKQEDEAFVPDEYGQEIAVRGDGFASCRGVFLQARDECGMIETYVSFDQQ